MPKRKDSEKLDTTTEAKIKEAARVVFHKKGYAATRTRDIAEEAQINLALLNYYFRSKEKLFELIMMETLAGFFQRIGMVFNDEKTLLESKVQLFAEKYIDLLSEEPEIPVFILSEIRSHGAEMLEKLPIANSVLQSVFAQQYEEAVKQGKMRELHPLHFLMNLLGLVVFPFVAAPLLKKIGKLENSQYNQLIQERKKMIPIWMEVMFKAN